MLKPTPEQEAIISATRHSSASLMISAMAGSAKTTTLTLAAKEVKIPGLALAFNVSIKKELEKKFPGNFSVQTMNGLGFASLRRALPAINTWNIDDKKLGKLVTEICKSSGAQLNAEQWDDLRSLCRAAQLAGIVPGGEGRPLTADSPEEWAALMDALWIPDDEKEWFMEMAREVLRQNNALAKQGTISFDDQVYYSTCVAGRFPQFPLLMVDEAQDLNTLQHAMLALSVRPTGRLIVCGDPLQAIYQFRGSHSDSMGQIEGLRTEWLRLPLTMTFRCPKVVVERQRHWAFGFRAAPGNKEGRYTAIPCAPAPRWTWADLSAHAPHPGASIAILCRNNAPLLSLAFRLLRQRIPITMLGRDIGQGLLALSRKLFSSDNVGLGEMTQRLMAWQQREEALALANGKEEKIDGIQDRAECLRAVLTYPTVLTSGDLRRELRDLFAKENGAAVLSSIHRAKGLEWDVVLLLDPWRVPSAKARAKAARGDDAELRAEMNLRYVAETRTKEVLLHANLAEFE